MIELVSHLPLTTDDKAWLKRILTTTSVFRRKELLTGYASIFEREKSNPEHAEHQAENRARTKANTWIRAQVKGVQSDIVKNCTTCEMMGRDGVCLQFREAPPEDFKKAKTQECGQWLLETPF